MSGSETIVFGFIVWVKLESSVASTLPFESEDEAKDFAALMS